MEKKLTTIIIGRQFGAGGRELGELLAKKLGIPYYDRSLLKVAAQRLGFDEEIFDNADERKPSILRSMLSINYELWLPTTLSVRSTEKKSTWHRVMSFVNSHKRVLQYLSVAQPTTSLATCPIV